MSQLTCAEIRSTLVDALQIDLVGLKPNDTHHVEEILEAFHIAKRVVALARRRPLNQERGKPPEAFDPPT